MGDYAGDANASNGVAAVLAEVTIDFDVGVADADVYPYHILSAPSLLLAASLATLAP